MLHITILLVLVRLAAGEFDEELNTKFLTMQRANFIEYFNEQNYTWKMEEYSSNFIININKHYDFNVFDFKNILPQRPSYNSRILNGLPKNFDSREQWPLCRTIGEIYNQYSCNSCWAHGVANTASDRICIHKGINVELSEQDLECAHPHKTICHSGYPTEGFKFWKDYGLVTRQCKPYEPLEVNRNECLSLCKYVFSMEAYFKNKHFAKEVYSLPNDIEQIKAEIYLNGPIQASMKVYEDFLPDSKYGGYRSGIYEHKFGKIKLLHSVRVIGYGVENGIEYWLAANTWGNTWGENGFFRIKTSQNAIEFEKWMTAGIPA